MAPSRLGILAGPGRLGKITPVGEKHVEVAPRKSESTGPGPGLYIGAGVLLVAAWAGVRLLMIREGPSQEEAPLSRQVLKPAPLPMPASRPAPTLTQESIGFTIKEADVANPSPNVHVPPVDIQPSLNFSGVTGPYAQKAYVIKTQAEWDAFWRSIGASDIPPLDNAEDVTGRGAGMAVVVCAGEQPAGTKVVIQTVELSAPRIMVSYKIIPPAARAGGTERPFQVIIIPRSNKAVSFHRSR